MPNTFRQWFKSVRLLIVFYGIFLLLPIVTPDMGNPTLLGWRIALFISALMTLTGLIGSWFALSKGHGTKFFPSLEYIGIWSIITVEASHAFYYWPGWALSHIPPSLGRSLSDLALALAVYLVARRRLRW